MSDADFQRQSTAQEEIEQMWKKEELYWKQRSTVNWLQAGGSNTRFFHLTTIQRRWKNRVLKLKYDRGVWISGEKNMRMEFHVFFNNLFHTSRPRNWEGIIDCIPAIVSKEMNRSLLVPFNEEEIQKVAMQLGAWKAPGADGFPGYFYQRYWQTVKTIVSRSAEEFECGFNCLEEINKTFIALIPKVYVGWLKVECAANGSFHLGSKEKKLATITNEEWDVLGELARGAIENYITDEVIINVMQDTTMLTWENLEEMFTGKSLCNKLFLKEELLNFG
ncbi:uncharacterized protein LOC110765086 [Prunus avium]|uniref:Uncharacterized protein LOC110765086 n=1 Tax=Prunus avium TaxID=42229 RepID=A0A6P5T9Q6_PRUAV|nr:uncharacterized protein LOC110765086 [Prunus avium]